MSMSRHISALGGSMRLRDTLENNGIWRTPVLLAAVVGALFGGLLVGVGNVSPSYVLGSTPSAASGAVVLAVTLTICVLLLRYLDMSVFIHGNLGQIDRELEEASEQAERAATALDQVKQLSAQLRKKNR
jgi:hypothetical protein